MAHEMVADILFGIVVVGMHGQQDVVCSVDVGVVYLCGRHDTPSFVKRLHAIVR